jgi:hypothetical protein
VEAESGNSKFTAMTDDHGIFDFKNLPLGKCRVTAPAAKGWVCDPYPYPWKEVEPGDIGQCVLHASTRDH